MVPASYTATVGQETYLDDTNSQLTDGVYGVDDWQADLGNGRAYEWVGWRTVNPTFTFDFARVVTLDKVFIDFDRDEGYGLINLPTFVNIGGTTFTLAGNELADKTRGTLEFEGSWTGSSLTIDFTRSSDWVFVDEMKFQAVPEPAGYALAAGLGLTVFGICRRCKSHSG